MDDPDIYNTGGVDELQKVKAFLSKHSREKRLKNQPYLGLQVSISDCGHMFCIPMDDSRPITNAEGQFFSTVETGKVPVIAVFTKCEALETIAVDILENQEELTYHDAVMGAPEYAKNNLQNIHLDLARYKYPPQGYVYLQEMEKPYTDCKDLIEQTASALSGDTLQAIFVSTQQVNLEASMRYAIK
ncbi:hypothetical protein BDZ94DRAFT_1284167 [Collybia nuda]|uniref:Uncharacterized protein n=1 Tax=Collybia nuda TaxID=64659 RepID=A0A9P5XZL0_9AGAR|nr:hypothetical protein BDZ94DRAFT_1284167 [Collybia nuda]